MNAAISLRAHVQVESRDEDGVELRSIDTGKNVSARHWSALDAAGGSASARAGRPALPARARHGDHPWESPAGAGIAGSSALAIAACGALARWTGKPSRPDALLDVAMNVECQTIKVPTGVQDYHPALYGGIAAIELGVGGVRRAPLRSIRTSWNAGSF